MNIETYGMPKEGKVVNVHTRHNALCYWGPASAPSVTICRYRRKYGIHIAGERWVRHYASLAEAFTIADHRAAMAEKQNPSF